MTIKELTDDYKYSDNVVSVVHERIGRLMDSMTREAMDMVGFRGNVGNLGPLMLEFENDVWDSVVDEFWGIIDNTEVSDIDEAIDLIDHTTLTDDYRRKYVDAVACVLKAQQFINEN